MIKLITLILVLLALSCTETKTDTHIKTIALEETKETLEEEPYELEPIIVMPSRASLLEPFFEIQESFVLDQNQFDEPRTEEGQEDGTLRPLWVKAWKKFDWRYAKSGDWYYTMNKDQSPRPPQVCADVIVDTYDRMGGSWWYAENGRGYRKDTPASFTKFIQDKDLIPRRVVDLIESMTSSPEYFQVLYDKKESGVRIGNFKELHKVFHSIDVQAGDVVFIYGKTKTGMHWHSFFMHHFVEDRSETGDWEIVQNSGMLAKRWLITEGRRTRRRRVWYVLRPTNLFLSKLQQQEAL